MLLDQAACYKPNYKFLMKFNKLFIVLLFSFAVLQARAAALPDSAKTFKVANLLQSNMVIQQNKPLRIWGWALAGDIVKIQTDWTSKAVIVHTDADGNWTGQVKVPPAVPGNFNAHSITITHNNDVVKLRNVLIGEVWICSGQSNMGLEVGKIPGWSPGILNYETELAAAKFPNIRLFREDMGIEFEPQADCKGKWQLCDSSSAAHFSAVGYYFGRALYLKLNVPIGLIDAAIPATACQAFTDVDVLNADTALHTRFVVPYLKGIEWAKQKNDKSTTLVSLNFPGLVYNRMIHPLEKLSTTGFIWYQGESNKEDTLLYPRLCTAMIKSWRKNFDQGDLPFYYVQVAPYSWFKGDTAADDYAKFRETQERVLKVKNTGMAVTMDVGEPNNIHPINKKPVGERLAAIALAKTYRVTGTVYQGPQFSGFKVSDGSVKLSFVAASVGSGLKTSNGREPKYFYLAGADKRFYKAAAVIVGDQVWLTAAKVPKPVAVRYAFTNFPITNFCNNEGLPAAPFRTDDWTN